MPRTRFDNLRPKDPPIDWIKAAMLERLDAKHMTLKELSAVTGLGYENLRVLMRKSPMDWKREQREGVCRALGIETVLTVVGQPNI